SLVTVRFAARFSIQDNCDLIVLFVRAIDSGLHSGGLQVRLAREKQEITQQLAREASAAQSRAIADYVGRIRSKIKGNIVMPGDMPAGNPEAIFDVVQLPTGEVLSPVRLKKSSGYKPYDEAIERAILKSSALPKPDRPDLFQRNLELKFRPLD
ncbi:MAG: energy transducer TonB, partial [Proteobacteria bacterium]|nr:energy transducer TonB [Pseudomonadota bacterium]